MDGSNFGKNILHYRGIHILNNDCNISFGKIFVPIMKLWLIMAVVIGFFTLLRLSNSLEWFPLAMVSIVAVVALLALLPISFITSSLYGTSHQFQRNMWPFLDLISDKKAKLHFEGQLKACSLIRCKIGNFYHMEAKAKLTVLHNILDGIVFLLVNAKT